MDVVSYETARTFMVSQLEYLLEITRRDLQHGKSGAAERRVALLMELDESLHRLPSSWLRGAFPNIAAEESDAQHTNTDEDAGMEEAGQRSGFVSEDSASTAKEDAEEDNEAEPVHTENHPADADASGDILVNENVNRGLDHGEAPQSSVDGVCGTASETSSPSGTLSPGRAACTACTEEGDIWQIGCEHGYCVPCLVTQFELATRDEQLFPPHCCGPIDIATVDSALPATLVRAYEAKKAEYQDNNRTYCRKPECASYINHCNIESGIATCNNCSRTTCYICKGAPHLGSCPKDEAFNQTLELAKANGWQRCPRCKSFVTLISGCNHVICRCRAEYCFLCLARWKTCSCPNSTRAHETLRPDDRVDLTAAVATTDAEPQVNTTCNHRHQWRRLPSSRCHVCQGDRFFSVDQCSNCDLIACGDCRNALRLALD